MTDYKEQLSKAQDLWLDDDTHYDEAIEILRSLLSNAKDDSDKAECLMYLGHVLKEQEKNTEAINAYDQALDLAKNEDFISAYSLFGKGAVLSRSEDRKVLVEAVSCLKKALELTARHRSDDAWKEYHEMTLSRLTLTLLLLDDIEQAEYLLNSAIKNHELPLEDLADEFMNLAHAYYKKQNYGKSSALYERALMTLPKDENLKAEIKNYLGRALYMQGDYQRAKSYLEESLPFIKDNEEWYDGTKKFLQEIKNKS